VIHVEGVDLVADVGGDVVVVVRTVGEVLLPMRAQVPSPAGELLRPVCLPYSGVC
jgi:hypothetical protein